MKIPGLCSKSGKSSPWKRSIERTFDVAPTRPRLSASASKSMNFISETLLVFPVFRLLVTHECRLIKHLHCQPDVACICILNQLICGFLQGLSGPALNECTQKRNRSSSVRIEDVENEGDEMKASERD